MDYFPFIYNENLCSLQTVSDKIKQKTAYRVQIDKDKLIENCVKEISVMPEIPKARLVSKTATIDNRNPGVT